ncbi:flagellar hook-length control protein FliK, partial [Motilibacter deserti]
LAAGMPVLAAGQGGTSGDAGGDAPQDGATAAALLAAAPSDAPSGSAAPATPAPTAPTTGNVVPSAPAAPERPQAHAPAHTPVASQVSTHVAGLMNGPDGVHRMVMQLHPADLGQVQIIAELRDGRVHLQLTGGTEAGREALKAALPDLKRDLADAGLSTGSLEVGSDGPGSFARGREGAQQRGEGRASGTYGSGDAPVRPNDIPTAPAPVRATGDRALDLRV